MGSKYDVDWDVLVNNLIPVRLRSVKLLAWLRVLVTGVKMLYLSFRYYMDDKMYYLAHNSQTCSMEGALNDTFDPTLRRLFITDGGWSHALFLWQPWEPRPQLTMYQPSEVTGGMPGVYLFQPAEVGPGSADFVVHIPLAIYWDTHRLGGLVNRYRLVCKGNWVEASF